MMDIYQEEKSEAWASIMSKLEELTPDELSAVANLCVAFVDEQDPNRLARQTRAIEGLVGQLTLAEWLVLAPVVTVRYGQVYPVLQGA